MKTLIAILTLVFFIHSSSLGKTYFLKTLVEIKACLEFLRTLYSRLPFYLPPTGSMLDVRRQLLHFFQFGRQSIVNEPSFCHFIASIEYKLNLPIASIGIKEFSRRFWL